MTPGGWGGDKWLVWLCCLIAVRADNSCLLLVCGVESGCFFWGRGEQVDLYFHGYINTYHSMDI